MARKYVEPPSTRRFQRTKEDFVCGNCGAPVKGNGYTNHCPECLWSRHVDINPGDRSASCNGMMRPVAAEYKSGEFILLHLCEGCGAEKRNRAAENDSLELRIELTRT